jgi:hypothetical protein
MILGTATPAVNNGTRLYDVVRRSNIFQFEYVNKELFATVMQIRAASWGSLSSDVAYRRIHEQIAEIVPVRPLG